MLSIKPICVPGTAAPGINSTAVLLLATAVYIHRGKCEPTILGRWRKGRARSLPRLLPGTGLEGPRIDFSSERLEAHYCLEFVPGTKSLRYLILPQDTAVTLFHPPIPNSYDHVLL